MIECRGRNGWFNLAESDAGTLHTGVTWISLASRNGYLDVAPIYLQGPKAELEMLLLDLLERVRQGKSTIPEPEKGAKFGGYWSEHPDHLWSDWMGEVEANDTRQGYWEWVENKVEQAQEEAEEAA